MAMRAQLVGAAVDAYLSADASRLRRKLWGAHGNRVELFFQVDDPYSYLLVQVLPRLLEAARLPLDFRLVSTSAATDHGLVVRRYGMRDAGRLAELYAIDFPADAGEPPPELIEEAQAVLAVERPSALQLPIAAAVARALWNGDAPSLHALAARHGRTPAARRVELDTRRLRRAGHYAPGMLRHRGTWYWGVDRLRHFRRDLVEDGVATPEVLIERPTSSSREVGATEGGDTTLGAPRVDRLEMFFSFRSPYSYIAAVRAIALAAQRKVELVIRPVLPMVMRGHRVPLAKRLYIVKDAAREARWYGVPFGRVCDPLGPGIERCLSVFYRARELGREAAFVESVGRGVWAEAVDVATDEGLRSLCERAGVAWPDAEDAIRHGRWQSETEANREALTAHGLWGVPAFVAGQLVVWGNDRLPFIERSLRGAIADVVDGAADLV